MTAAAAATAFGLARPAPACAQEAPLEGCTFDATVTGFFSGEFQGRAWIGSPRPSGGGLDLEEARALHLCVGSRSSGVACADPRAPKLFQMSLPLPAPGETGGYARDGRLVVKDRAVFRSGQVDDWITLGTKGTLQVASSNPGLEVREHRMAALDRTYVDSIYRPAVRGSFQATVVPSWKQIRPNTTLSWVEGGQTHEADPKLQVEVSFNAGTLVLDPEASTPGSPAFQCTAAVPFGILARSPDEGHRNVDFEDGAVEVTFTAPLDRASLAGSGDGSVQVGYLDPEGTFVETPGDLSLLAGGRTLRFTPDSPLKDAVHYRVRVKGGRGGVRGHEDEHLPSDVEWSFGTVPDLSGEGEASGEAELHVFQVARNAELVPGKASVLRVYADWEPDPDVHDDDEVIRARAEISVTDGAGTRLFEDETFEFVRSDRYEEQAVRTAEAQHTANLFGWEPERGDGSPLEATLAFRSDATGEEREFTARREVEYWDHSPEFAFDYYFLKIGPWADGVPSERVASGRLAAERAETFTLQNFPVVGVTSRNGGAYDPGLGLAEKGEDALWETVATIHDMAADSALLDGDPRTEDLQAYRTNRLNTLLWLFNDAVAPYTNAQVLVAFVPLNYTGVAAGGAHFDRLLEAVDGGAEHYVSRLVHMPVRGDIYLANLLTHEFGHSFDLEHVPYVEDAAAREEECRQDRGRFPGIEGFRIAADGRTGWNKSHEEGNAESDDRLYPLMHPCGQRKAEAFVLNEQYRRLLSSISGAIRSGTYEMAAADGPGSRGEWGRFAALQAPGAWAPSTAAGARRGPRGPSTGNRQSGFAGPAAEGPLSDEWWRVSGILRADGRRAGFAPLAVVEGDRGPRAPAEDVAPDPEGFTVELRSGAGGVLHSAAARVSPEQDSGGWRHFRALIPLSQEADRVVLLHEGRVIGERRRSSSPPLVEISNRSEVASAAGAVTVRWEGTDPDGDDLVYTVLYSPDGGDRWRVLSGLRLRPAIEVDLDQLPGGDAPTLRVIARDGFHQAEDRLILSR